MQLVMSITQRLEVPCCETVFPAVNELLAETDYQKALAFVGHRKDMDRYWSVVDFLFAELIGGKWRQACFRFYDGEGPQLKDHPDVTPEKLAEWEMSLVRSLDLAHDMYEIELECSWKVFRRQWH
tara:strand:+ start:199 stop:573 length:375 start_codon:yes stop_codon:yes gene_type:complete